MKIVVKSQFTVFYSQTPMSYLPNEWKIPGVMENPPWCNYICKVISIISLHQESGKMALPMDYKFLIEHSENKIIMYFKKQAEPGVLWSSTFKKHVSCKSFRQHGQN